MKVCGKCGALNSDNRFFCVDCHEKLGDAVSERERNDIEQDIDTALENLYNDNDPLYVSRFDKVMGFLSLVGAAASLALLVVGFVTKRDFGFLWVAIACLVLAAVEALVPRFTWSLEQLRLSRIINGAEDAEPSAFYKTSRKICILIGAGVGIAVLLITVLDFRHPPIVAYISDIAATESVAMSSNLKDYIDANPEKWEEIIAAGDYAVNVFIDKLEAADTTGLEKLLMIKAITAIKGDGTVPYSDKDEVLFDLYTGRADE